MKQIPCVFVVGLLIFFPALLVAQDDSSQQGTGSGPMVSHSVGVQYSSMTGFMPFYRLELMGPLVRNKGLMLEGKLTNDFAIMADMLSTSLTARFAITPLLSLALEIPASFLYRFPADLQARVAGSARLSLGNRSDPGDQSPGWVLSSELSSTASASWTGASSLAAFGTLTGSQPDNVLPYQAAGLLEVGYRGSVLSPDLKLVATYDLDSLALADVKGTAALNLGLGARERSLALSAETMLFASPGDTNFKGQLSWDKVVGGVSLGISKVLTGPVFDYGISLTYRF